MDEHRLTRIYSFQGKQLVVLPCTNVIKDLNLQAVSKCVVNEMQVWVSDKSSSFEYDFYDIVRSIAGDNVRRVELVNEVHHPEKGETCHCYLIEYNSLEDELFNQMDATDLNNSIGNALCDNVNIHRVDYQITPTNDL